MTTLTEQTPIEIDTQLSSLYEQSGVLQMKAFNASKSIKFQADALARIAEGRSGYGATPEQLARYEAELADIEAAIEDLREQARPLEAEFTRRGGWTRAFLVANTGGHVHRDMSCSTCFDSTRYAWMVDYSGQSEAQIVEAAGSRACTVCYPSAPVEVLSRPTQMFSKDEIAAQAARDERAQAKIERDAAKAAKAISHPDGLAVRDAYGNETKTESGAQIGAVDNLLDTFMVANHAARGNEWGTHRADERASIITINTEALAHKRGTDIPTQERIIREKALAKYIREVGDYALDLAERKAELKALRAEIKAAAKA